jgi:hypothetical protein
MDKDIVLTTEQWETLIPYIEDIRARAAAEMANLKHTQNVRAAHYQDWVNISKLYNEVRTQRGL